MDQGLLYRRFISKNQGLFKSYPIHWGRVVTVWHRFVTARRVSFDKDQWNRPFQLDLARPIIREILGKDSGLIRKKQCSPPHKR